MDKNSTHLTNYQALSITLDWQLIEESLIPINRLIYISDTHTLLIGVVNLIGGKYYLNLLAIIEVNSYISCNMTILLESNHGLTHWAYLPIPINKPENI